MSEIVVRRCSWLAAVALVCAVLSGCRSETAPTNSGPVSSSAPPATGPELARRSGADVCSLVPPEEVTASLGAAPTGTTVAQDRTCIWQGPYDASGSGSPLADKARHQVRVDVYYPERTAHPPVSLFTAEKDRPGADVAEFDVAGNAGFCSQLPGELAIVYVLVRDVVVATSASDCGTAKALAGSAIQSLTP